MVAKGFTQVEGIGFIDTFSPVAKLVSFRVLLCLATMHSRHLIQLDVSNVFLKGTLSEEVYMELPPGYLQQQGTVCKLHRSLYGLRQTSSNRFSTKSCRPLSFMKGTVTSFMALVVYIDDIILVGKDINEINRVKSHLQCHFYFKDLGPLRVFLGFEIT